MERPAQKPFLITPSVSPPVSRSFFPQPHRIPDQASPTKRARLSSAPRQFQPHASAPSSTTSTDQVDFHKAREASAMRMLDVWSNLAERYSRPLDEDDIIDLNTGKVVKDRGIIRGSRNWDLGCFADDVGGAEAEEGDDEDEDEDDIDELDSFAHGGTAEEDALGTEVDLRILPPVTEMDPADAEDLRQFLEAEQRRKDACGSEIEETGSLIGESQDERGEDDYTEYSDEQERAENPKASSEYDATPEIDDETPATSLEGAQTSLHSTTVLVDSGSDDELVSWGLDEASMVHRLPKKEEVVEDDSDSEIEFIDPPLPPARSRLKHEHAENVQSKPSQAKKNNISPRQKQLHTPPQSQSSSVAHSATPSDDYFADLPPDSSSPPRPSPVSSSPLKSSPMQPPRHFRSAGFIHEPSVPPQSRRGTFATPIPRLDLTKVSKSRNVLNARYPPTELTPSRARTSSRDPSSISAQESIQQLSEEHAVRPTEPEKLAGKTHIEVVIDKRAPFQPNLPSTTGFSQLDTGANSSGRSIFAEEGKEITKRRGKEEQVASIANADQISAPKASSSKASSRSTYPRGIPRAQSRAPRGPGQTQSDPKPPAQGVSSAQKFTDVGMSASKKRKRVVSSSEVDHIPVDTMNVSPDPQNKTKVDLRKATPGHTRADTTPSIENETSSKDSKSKIKLKRKPTIGQKGRSSSRPRQSDDSESSSTSSSEPYPENGRRSSRARSRFGSVPSSDHYYLYPEPLYPPYHHQPPAYAPITDPRAQYIISQAMHQLSVLVGGPWTPPGPHNRGSTPFTPSHHRHHSSSVYSTPTHHTHPYPYSYDPALSRATLPPESPEAQSSSPIASGSGVRHRSLVKRSRSRGRRVSFRIEESVIDALDIASPAETNAMLDSDDLEADEINHLTQKKLKGKASIRSPGGSSDDETSSSRGRAVARAQTPGPPVRINSLGHDSGIPNTKRQPGRHPGRRRSGQSR